MSQLKAKPKSDRLMPAEFRTGSGIIVTIRYTSERRFMDLSKKATKSIWKDHRLVEERDDAAFYDLCADEMIVSWRGLYGHHLRTMVDLVENPFADDDEVPYSKETARLLLRECLEFDLWATRHCKTLEEFVAMEDDKRKNASLPSPSGPLGSPAAEAVTTSIASDAMG